MIESLWLPLGITGKDIALTVFAVVAAAWLPRLISLATRALRAIVTSAALRVMKDPRMFVRKVAFFVGGMVMLGTVNSDEPVLGKHVPLIILGTALYFWSLIPHFHPKPNDSLAGRKDGHVDADLTTVSERADSGPIAKRMDNKEEDDAKRNP